MTDRLTYAPGELEARYLAEERPGLGNTPLVEISPGLVAKVESGNPSGSIKDRMAHYVMWAARQRGVLKPGDTVVEATSGNTGIAIARLAQEQGYHAVIVMPENMSPERMAMIHEYGARIVKVGPSDFAGACAMRDAIVGELGAFCPDQFCTPDNITAHRITTGAEILQQTGDREISAIVAGTGTGGTLMGAKAALLDRFPLVQAVAVEPSESAVMHRLPAGVHGIQGIGDGFIPPLVDMRCVDFVEAVSTADAIERCRQLNASGLGLAIGISSGANVAAAERWMEEHQPRGLVVTILSDSVDRYGSMLE